MADGLVADRVERRESLDVVTEVVGDIVELLIRQHRGGGEVVGHPETSQRARFGAGELTFVDQGVDQCAELQVGQFGGEFEHLLPAGEVAADLQRLGLAGS